MAQTFTTRPEIRGTFGVVSTTHWIASAVGMAALEKGGNAFDAAVAAGFTLQIVEPHLVGPGGDVPIILQAANEDAPRVLCGQGITPAGATIEHYKNEDLKLIPGTGLLASVVPGSFDAWMQLLRDYGTMTVREVLEPAIGYAENGYPLLFRAAAAIHVMADFFRDEWPTSAAVWLPGGEAPNPNQMMRVPSIANAYKRILSEAESVGGDREAQIEAARKTFYEGFVAEAIDRFYAKTETMDSTGEKHMGVLTGADMAGWRASYETPLSYDYGGVTVHKTGPWGQGPMFLQALALLKDTGLGDMDPVGADFVHTTVEAIKLAAADRDAYYADPVFADVPMETLLSDDYNTARRKLIEATANGDLRPGDAAPDWEARRDTLLALEGCETGIEVGAGEPTFADLPEVEGDTVHLDVVDRWGNMISATPSGGWLQSAPAIPELGFNMSTRLQMSWLDERLPGKLTPGARPRTTLTPTFVTRDGAPYLALGTPGGDQQDQWSLITFLRIVHGTHNLQAAIDTPLFNTKHMVSSFYPRGFLPRNVMMEGRFDEAVIDEMRSRGHDISVEDDWALGRLCMVSRSKSGVLRGAATPRLMQAYAIGR